MNTETATLTMTDSYPFSHPKQYDQYKTNVQVRKIVPMGVEPRFVMKEKVRCLKSLGSNLVVALITTSEEDNSLNLLFEYVQRKLEDQQWTMDPQVADRIQNQLFQLAGILAAHWMTLDLRFQNIGLDKYFRLKYFLGFDFKIDKSASKDQLVRKYRHQIEEMFGQGGRFRRTTSPTRLSKPEYYSTMDTTNDRGRGDPNNPEGKGGRLMMKKSATVTQNHSQKTFNELQEWWQGSNQGENRLMMSVGSESYNRSTTHQIKAVKVQDLGARINKLKNYMKEVTGKTPKGRSTLGQCFVKLDQNNSQNRIYQENKMLVTPNYTKLEKKIAEFRASRFYRGNCEKEILYTKDNKGYILTTKDRIENPQGEPSRPRALDFAKKETMQGAATPRGGDKKIPSYLLKKDKSKATDLSRESKAGKEEMNSSKIRDESSCCQKDYKKMGKTDKYCEEFMYFLEDDEHQETQQDGEMSPLTRLISQIGTQVNEERSVGREERQSLTDKSESSSSAVEIHGRVQKAIRNSLKLISGLKYRESRPVK